MLVYIIVIFLHHILNLPNDDPVREAYEDQKLYSHESNWFNEVCVLLEKYGVAFNEESIKSSSKNKWKDVIHKAITDYALLSLGSDCSSKSRTESLTYTALSLQPYFQNLSPAKARIYFQLRGGVFDVKCNRSYMYHDTICRLCGGDTESVHHVLNECSEIRRSNTHINDIYNLSEEDIPEMLDRIISFKEQLDKKE